MSTRKLILASLICGILIVVAGTVKLFQASEDSTTPPDLFAIGTTVQIAGVTATVNELRVTEEKTLVNVSMSGLGGDSAIEGWSMLANGSVTRPLPTTTCPTADGATECIIEFVVAIGTPTIVYARGDESSQWLGE
nr:hypothetical protein [Acidobacteriota bacterium]